MSERLRPRSQKFPRQRRLNSEHEFRDVRERGKSVHGKLMTLGVLRLENDEPARAGFITSRRVGSAVVRNRIRRQLREIFRLHQYEIASGVWTVTITRMNAARASYAELEAEWLRLAKRASILAP